jgi:hypothetical protein
MDPPGVRSLAVAAGLLLLLAAPAAAVPAWMRVPHIVVPGDLNN